MNAFYFLETVVIGFFLLLVALLLIVPMIVIIVECLLALTSSKRESELDLFADQLRPLTAVLIPAHNEESVIEDTIKSILPQLEVNDMLLVVADNCIDATAAVALKCGAKVVVRDDDSCQGKGYALDFGIRALEEVEPEFVIIIDADCHAEEGSIETLSKTSAYLDGPVQAVYLMRSENNVSSDYEVFGQFAWVIKNRVRPLGLLQVGMPCPLTGSGMAFPWHLIKHVNLANGHIAEDLKLSLELVLGGFPTTFCPEALISSVFPLEISDQRLQRKRWEHGYLNLLIRFVPKLCSQAIKKHRFELLVAALDLMVPPLALLCLLLLGSFVIVGIGAVFGFWLPLMLLMGTSVIFLLTLMFVRNVFAKEVISIRQLLRFPVYIAMKLPLYLEYFFDRETVWRNTRRRR